MSTPPRESLSTLSLHSLATSLPLHQQLAEKELTEKFKVAAQSLTTLYKSSRDQSKLAFEKGYEAALRDVLAVVVRDHPNSHMHCDDCSTGGGGTTAPSNGFNGTGGKSDSRHRQQHQHNHYHDHLHVKEWIEKRLDAVGSNNNHNANNSNHTGGIMLNNGGEDSSSDESNKPPSPKPSVLLPLQPALPFNFANTNIAAPSSPELISAPPITIGSKRRHAIMLESSQCTPPPPVAAARERDRERNNRRKPRSLRSSHVNVNADGLGMDVDVVRERERDEDGGRERKRLAIRR